MIDLTEEKKCEHLRKIYDKREDNVDYHMCLDCLMIFKPNLEWWKEDFKQSFKHHPDIEKLESFIRQLLLTQKSNMAEEIKREMESYRKICHQQDSADDIQGYLRFSKLLSSLEQKK